MGLEVGHREYHPPAPSADMRSLSAKRSAIIRWHRAHPHSFRLFQKAERQLEKSHGKVRAYNETRLRLMERIGKTRAKGKRLPLIACFQRVCNLKEGVEKEIPAQTKARNRLAQHMYDWRTTLPMLDEQISAARKLR